LPGERNGPRCGKKLRIAAIVAASSASHYTPQYKQIEEARVSLRMRAVTLVFPHQLFQQHPSVMPGRTIVLLEDDLFFTHYRFHQQKLILHRASMKAYQAYLIKQGFDVRYQEAEEGLLQKTLKSVVAEGMHEVHVVDPVDYLLERRLKRYCRELTLRLVVSESPNFICDRPYINQYFDSRKRYFLTEFYIDQRKRLNLLLDGQEPVGKRWTFDVDNRKKMPATLPLPALPDAIDNEYTREAKQYVRARFAHHPGSTEKFVYPVTFAEAEQQLERFLANRFRLYGDYQDALSHKQSFLFHSVLTPALNIGLLTPAVVLDRAIAAAAEYRVPLNALEGFVRQVLGWREFLRAVYQREGVRQRTTNFWHHTRPLPSSFWEARTGILPLDHVIEQVLQTGYANHIERLMVLGNFMLLAGFHPDDVYRWFMELFIDAYDWVMVPNVYGMSQYADGGLMATKPYVSGSNYLLKMSDYPKGDWCATWDALYWGFIHQHRDMFRKNPRMSMMVRQLEKIDPIKTNLLLKNRDMFLASL
jgi:deoxyribodipyrimidine photolyase-related protein